MNNSSLKIAKTFHKEDFELLEHMRPHIRIAPFQAEHWQDLSETESSATIAPGFWLDDAKKFYFFYNGRSALYACLIQLKLKSDDEVVILTTTNGPYISGCVTKTIERVCKWSRTLSDKTRLALVIHEFGFPVQPDIIQSYKNRGLPVLEDCAYALGSRIEGSPIGKTGDYALYSLMKYYPCPFGGVLAAKSDLGPEAANLQVGELQSELLHNVIANANAYLRQWNKKRQQNWLSFAEVLKDAGLEAYHDLDEQVVPGVYLTKVPEGFQGEKVKAKLNGLGVESTLYYNQGGFYFPCHQFLTEWERRYILYHFLS